MKLWFRFENKDDGARAEIYIYGEIVDDMYKWFPSDVTPTEFLEELDRLKDAKQIDIYINSPGGLVSSGLAIYHALKRHPANKIIHNDGIIASIASVIAMAGDKIIMPKTSLMLVHKAMVMFAGNADDFIVMAAELEKFDLAIAAAYVDKTGMDTDELKALMSEDRFMNAEEALELGFVDEIEAEKDIKASLSGEKLTINGLKMDVSRFKNFPRDQFPAKNARQARQQPAAELPKAVPAAQQTIPQTAENSVLQAIEPASAPAPVAAKPDFSVDESQINFYTSFTNH